MLSANGRRARQVAGWAGVACIALLVAACNSSINAAVASASSLASVPATSAAASGSPSTPASAPASPPTSPSVTVSPTGTSTFLAQGQDLSRTLLYTPACDSGCQLSGDGTATLDKMTWRTWSAAEAVGTGTYELDACNPNCAAGPIDPVAAVVTLSDPVKVCSSSGTRRVWTRASFTFPDGLPKALQGGNGPNNPWVFDNLISAAQQSCAN